MPDPVVLGGTWTITERPCAMCAAEHHHLTDLSDGRAICLPCSMPFLRLSPPEARRKDSRDV
jgi:hypothetical protein